MVKVSPETALAYTKLSVILMFTWPPWPESGRLVKVLFNVFSWVFMGVSAFLVILLLNAARYQLDNYLIFTKTVCLAISCSQSLIKMLLCKGQRAKLEMLQCRVKGFLKTATPREREILQCCVNRFGPVHFASNMTGLAASLAMICGPLVLPQSLPTDAKYPFNVENHPTWDFAYIHQALAGLQCAEIGCVDCQAALLIWFAAARLELLAIEFSTVASTKEFNVCIRKHQVLLKNAEDIAEVVRFIIATTSTMTIISIIFAAIHVVSDEPILIKAQFVMIVISFAVILFVTAWPSEYLINACHAVGEGAYNSPWIQASPELRKNMLLVVQRSQKPIVISVASVLPKLSLSYYASFLSKTLSFFTTLRIILGGDGDGT